MCLTLKKSARRQCAKRDIPVWKVLTGPGHYLGKFCSIYFYAKWRAGCRKQSVLERKPFITLGGRADDRYDSVYKGLHAFTTKGAACRYAFGGSEIVIPMIVPRGSYYYVSRNSSQIAATAMRWPK